jgi:hypothetical protein
MMKIFLLKFAHTLELVHVVFGHLGDLEQPQLAFVVDQRTSLDD